jgi:hypothetical protein
MAKGFIIYTRSWHHCFNMCQLNCIRFEADLNARTKRIKTELNKYY